MEKIERSKGAADVRGWSEEARSCWVLEPLGGEQLRPTDDRFADGHEAHCRSSNLIFIALRHRCIGSTHTTLIDRRREPEAVGLIRVIVAIERMLLPGLNNRRPWTLSADEQQPFEDVMTLVPAHGKSSGFSAELALLVVESAADFAMITMNGEGIVTAWNPGADKLLGWSAEEAIGHHTRMIYTPADQEAGTPEDEMQRAAADGRSVNERWHVRNDGTRFWGSGLLIRLDGDAGYAKIMRDRTADREAERRFQALTDALPGFVFISDSAGHNAQVNAEYRNFTGRSMDELLGDRWLETVHPEDRERASENWGEQVRVAEVYASRLRFRRHDGEYRCFDCRAVPQRDDEGHPVQWIGTCIDVENEAQARSAIEELNRNLEQAVTRRTAELEAQLEGRLQAEAALRQSQKMEAIGQLTGGVAHDFNNLLTVIRSSADLLRRPELTEAKRHRYVDAIADTADRAAKLTRQLLAFARREALAPVTFDASERVRGLVDLLSTTLGGRIAIRTEFLCKPCNVEADPTQFDTALVNMAVNARDAMNGEGTLEISLREVSELPPLRGHKAAPGSFVALRVSDTGNGIATEHLPRIFEPFFTTKDVGQGTGLGLSQVFGFAKQSGGDIEVRSQIGVGTDFLMYIPHSDGRPMLVDQSSTSDRERASLGKGCVLVVEDNLMVGEFAAQLLEELGYETHWVANGAAALALLQEQGSAIDLVFTDVVMPGMSGIELAQEIRRKRPGLPIVLTSGYSHILAEQGSHGFELLKKPYSVEALSRVLRHATGLNTPA
jgi:PAS domain S-box-containing protein